MSFARRAFQSRRLLTSSARVSSRTPSTSRAWQLTSRRGYASGGHGEHKAGSDVPWMIGSVVVTVPVAGWLWSQGPSADEHGHDDHGEHAEEHGSSKETHDVEEEEQGNEKEDKPADGTDPAKDDNSNEPEPAAEKNDEDGSKDDAKDDNKKAEPKKDDSKKSDSKKDDSKPKDKSDQKDDSESDSDSESDGKDTPDTSDDEKEAEGSGSEQVGGKPYASLQPDKTQNQGAAGYKEKVGQTEGEGPKASTGAIHRARNHDDKTLSKKAEGIHDTARITEPVDPFRKAK